MDSIGNTKRKFSFLETINGVGDSTLKQRWPREAQLTGVWKDKDLGERQGALA